ncbi:MAG TPA: type II and III secretion system protein [Burkholderiales bacterium]|nr:type II and III secretion system protein [Burkholderiales bacterium]
MKWGNSVAIVLVPCVLAGCGQAPIKPAANHLRADEASSTGAIPPPVQVSPVLPKPKPAVRPETYSVVVNNVRVQELLFALARDARLQIDIDPNLSGSVTLNAIDQTLPQLLARIARQVDMRYELDGDTLVVMRDSPFLRAYKIDYLSAARNVKMQSTASTQFGTAQSGTPSATGATSTIDVTAQNNLWDSVVQNVKEILRETDKIIPAASAAALASASAAAAAAPAAGTAGAPGATPQPPIPPAPLAQPSVTYQEAASVIANRESGVLFVRATAKQHEKVQEFLDQVLAGAKRQVLIEATVAEVQLRNEYQRGISWERLRNPGVSFGQPAIQPTTSATPGFNPSPFFIGFVSSGGSFSVTLKLLEQFGDVRVLSSPKLSVLNNQTAILRVTRDIIYFNITPSGTPVAVSGGGTAVVQPSFTTTPNIAAEGFMMAVLPQVSAADQIVLNVRPTIRRRVDSVTDPNPALQPTTSNPNAVPNIIPVFETREFDSMLRLQSGQIGVLAGLMQDIVENTDTGIPGIRSIPIIGEMLSSRSDLSRKSELVIFLRATVIQDPTLDGDFRTLRNQLPGQDFFSKPNPGKIQPPLGPGDRPLY